MISSTSILLLSLISDSRKFFVRNVLLWMIPVIFFTSTSGASAQHKTPETKVPGGILVTAIIVDGDTMVFTTLPTFYFFSPKTFKNRKEKVEYTRLMHHVKKVYPYARLAGIKLREYNELMLASPSDKSRKQLMKQAEEELEAQFGKELRKLTFTQGVILLKLIDRETGETGYDLLSELRGTFRAFFWQGIGRLFG